MGNKPTAKEIQEHLKFMGDPDKWPHWPLLPVKKWAITGKEDDIGVLIADNKPNVYLGNIWDIEKEFHNIKEIADKCTKVTFASFEELIKVWRVD